MNICKSGSGIKLTGEAKGRICGDGVELAFGYWPGRCSPVVALHGLTASYVNFIGIAEQLAGRRALFAVDLRGRGDSDKPNGPYGMAQHARDVAVAMRTLGVGPSVIVGYSMGALVATAMAVQSPELVSGLVLIDGGYQTNLTSGIEAQQVLDPVLALRISQLRQTYHSREAYRQFWGKQLNFPLEDWGPWLEAFLNYELEGDPPQMRPKALEQAVRADLVEGLQTAAIAARLRRVRVPVLMFRAEAGFAPNLPPLYSDSLMQEIRSFLPHGEDETISGTTHYTIVLGKRGASLVADRIHRFANRCEEVSQQTERTRSEIVQEVP